MIETSSQVVVSCRNLRFSRGATEVLHGIHFEAASQGIIGLLGKNGAGKSTTIGLLMGNLTPDSGECRLFGEPSHDLSNETKVRIGILHEGFVQYDFMRIAEVERFYSRFYPRWDASLFWNLVDRMHAPSSRRIAKLSCGQRSQVTLGLLLAQRPDLLILDDCPKRERRRAQRGIKMSTVLSPCASFALWGRRTAALTGGLLLTGLLLTAGFLPTPVPPVASEHVGRAVARVAYPLETDTPREVAEASSQPTPETPMPDQTIRTETLEMSVDVPDLPLDFTVNPNLIVGVAVPAMPQTAVAASAPAVEGFAGSVGLDAEPGLLFSPPPVYPASAKRRNLSATVMVSLLVDERGRVVKSSVLPGPHSDLFARETLKAVRQWRFKPAEKNGRPVAAMVERPVHFRLTR